MNDIKESIRNFILSKYLPGESAANLRDNAALQTSGILDSLAVLGLASFIEKKFNIELNAADVGVENFDCIKDIASLVARKQAR